MRTLFIPARAGSTRIKRKNVRDFAGQPMISWPLRAAKGTGLFSEIIVSTDDQEIAEVSEAVGARIVWRPDRLADDFSNTTQVVQDALKHQLRELDEDSWFYKLYPTSPLDEKIISEFVDFAEQEDGFSVSVGKFRNHVSRSLVSGKGGRMSFLMPEFATERSQDLQDHYYDAGKLYGAKVINWKATLSPLLESPRGFNLPLWASIDIDGEEDWSFAETLFLLHNQDSNQ